MAKNNIPMQEMTLIDYGLRFFQDAKAALAEMPRASRWFHAFWLLGPFILLIERSPADAWLTFLAISFVVRVIIKRQSDWLRAFWVRSIFAFWFVCLTSAALSELPGYSFIEAFIWVRFPLFAMACCFWLGRDRRLVVAMIGSCLLAMLLMSMILLLELIFIGMQFGRLSWPYGDFVTGNYLAKASMPAFCVVAAIASSSNIRLALPASIIFLFTLIMSLFTGERMNFLLRSTAALVASLSWKPSLKMLLPLCFGTSLVVALSLAFNPLFINRVFDFFRDLPTDFSSPYLRVWYGGIEAFHTSPIIGIGPDNYRMMCSKISGQSAYVDCHTQPHNFYIQIAAETGLIGLLFAIVMILSLMWVCFKGRICSNKNVITATAYVVPFAFFFPLQSTADFFGQWNNIFMWSALGVAMSSVCSR